MLRQNKNAPAFLMLCATLAAGIGGCGKDAGVSEKSDVSKESIASEKNTESDPNGSSQAAEEKSAIGLSRIIERIELVRETADEFANGEGAFAVGTTIVWLRGGGESSGKSLEAMTEEIVSATPFVAAKASELGHNPTKVAEIQMAGSAMLCHLVTQEGRPSTKEAYHSVLDQTLAHVDIVFAKAKDLDYSLSLLEAQGVAAIVLTCHLAAQPNDSRKVEVFETFLVEILAGAESVLAKAKTIRRNISLATASSMGSKAMAYHLHRSDDGRESKQTYEALLNKLLVHAERILAKAEQDDRNVSMNDAFDTAAKEMFDGLP